MRGLSEEAIAALRPLDIDVGPETRAKNDWGLENGYRKHVHMIRFLWSQKSVREKLKALRDKDMRRKARAAYQHLKHTEESAYWSFVLDHKKFQAKHDGKATDAQRRRPPQFLEEVGLECALWPQLYWTTEMCETHERDSDSRRAAPPKKKMTQHVDSDDSAGEGSGDEGEERHSMKRSFLAKAQSPLLGYGADFELVQFVYDLNLWSALGSKKNLNTGVPLRILMAGHSFTGLYWKRIHQGLVDLVRQIGPPTLFWTLSPYEWGAPYHELIRDEMQKLLRQRLHLPVSETLHLAHVMTQIVTGAMTGCNQQRSGPARRKSEQSWTKHVFSCKDGSGRKTVVNFFTRLEFQDGSRKAPTQAYHGSGRVHMHCLFWLENVDAIGLDKAVSATAPDGNMGAFARGAQKDQDGESTWPVREEPSVYDADRERLFLHHTEDDWAEGLRAYFPDILDATSGWHQDVQMTDGEALLLQYVTKYVSKFSDANYDEWFNDEAEADCVAWRVLKEYHPLEPEMILQLAGANFRQWACGTASRGMRHLVAPDGTEETQPLTRYMECQWRRDDMSFLEYMRKSTQEGNISGWLKKKHAEHAKAGGAESLEAFANDHRMTGEQIVSVDTVYRLNDKFYKQWV
ncbi:MAG TPA: hypothetical protein EYG39_04720, partial [Rhodothermales bacterium]|nr:hypothetical protein [Rhodothermales bacterium]